MRKVVNEPGAGEAMKEDAGEIFKRGRVLGIGMMKMCVGRD